MKVMAFKIGDNTIACDMNDVLRLDAFDLSNIKPIGAVTKQSKGILGFINTNTGLISVLDTAAYFEIKKPETYKMIVIIKKENNLLAIPVSNTLGMIGDDKENKTNNNAIYKRFDIIENNIIPIINVDFLFKDLT